MGVWIEGLGQRYSWRLPDIVFAGWEKMTYCHRICETEAEANALYLAELAAGNFQARVQPVSSLLITTDHSRRAVVNVRQETPSASNNRGRPGVRDDREEPNGKGAGDLDMMERLANALWC
jgi:hypothetical protein